MNEIELVVDEIIRLYKRYGSADYIGEPVSQIEHMSQAAQLAIAANFDDEVVLAAFFHDIGHICVQFSTDQSMDGYGVKRHEQIGANFLRAKGFPERIARLVEGHVSAKRYLTYKNPEYFESLSQASKKTLEYQGGVMTTEEAKLFELDPLFSEIIQLRMWDELAKEEHKALIDLNVIATLSTRVLLAQAK